MQAHIFVPCFVDQLYPQTAVNMVTVLRQVGIEVAYNPNQTCCGQPAFNAGHWDEAKVVAEKFLNDFRGVEYIVCPSASCVGFVRNYLKELLADKYAATVFEQISKTVFEFSEFMVQFGDLTKLQPMFKGKLMYHDSCSALRECKIKDEPRMLLEAVEGLEVIENSRTEECCGFGGTFAVKFEPISVSMAQQKVQSALDLGAEGIVSTDQSCLMHLQGYIDANKLPLKTYHIADLLI